MTSFLLLSKLVEGDAFAVVRDGPVHTLGFVGLAEAGALTFLDQRRYLRPLRSDEHLAAVIASETMAEQVPTSLALATAAEPRLAFFRLHNRLVRDTDFYGPHMPSEISSDALVDPRAYVAPWGVRIGPRCRVDPLAAILPGSDLLEGAWVETGAAVGASGFQRAESGGEIVDLLHAGRVVLGERVRVMANAVIARAVFRDATVIGPDCLIGNNAFVSHRVRMGQGCRIGHGAVVAGNCLLGDGVVIGPGASVADRLTLGEGAQVTLGATVVRDVPAGRTVRGPFAGSGRRGVPLSRRPR